MLGRSLKKWGYDVLAVDNIEEASAVILRDSIQFVLTDWVMPGGDGPTLCRRIRELNLPFYIYIILVTSLEGSQSLVEGMDAGADDFIHKPIQMDELLARIRAGERVLQLERSLYERNVELEALSNNLLAAQNIINADLKVAEKIQRKLLPTRSSSLLGVSMDGLFCPSSHVSGDIYNFFRLDEQRIGFYSIDVAGHGVAAAMMSLTLSQLLIPEIKPGNPLKYLLPVSPYYCIASPASLVVDMLNQQFQTDATDTLYFTMIYGVIDIATQTIDICQAGHPTPIYLPKAGPAQFIGDGGFPVGITLMAEYESMAVPYQMGDRLFFYSDGITECMDNQDEMYGQERLLAFVEETRALPIEEVLSLLEQRMVAWRGSKKFDDDISMLAIVMIGNM
jgi:sigma-B regulation protein RsbU (phosphoserine phosphatase)